MRIKMVREPGPGERLIKAFVAEIKQASDANREITHAITARVVDRDGDVVEPRGMRAEAYRKNPIVLLGHWGDLPIGRNVGLEVSDQEVIAVTRFAGLDQNHAEAETAYRLYRDGFMRAWSIGFQPVTWSEDKALPEQDGWWFQAWELLEYSAVPVPSNPEALSRAMKAYSLPAGATEKDLLDAIRKDRRPFFDVGAALARGAKQEGTSVQSLILSKEKFPTKDEANAWVREHDFDIKEGAPDETENSWRYRQFPPGDCRDGAMDNGATMATISLADGVQGVICKRKEESALKPEEQKIGKHASVGDHLYAAHEHLAGAIGELAQGAADALAQANGEMADQVQEIMQATLAIAASLGELLTAMAAPPAEPTVAPPMPDTSGLAASAREAVAEAMKGIGSPA